MTRPTRALVACIAAFVVFGAVAVGAAWMIHEIATDSFRADSWAEVPATVVAADLHERAPTGRSRSVTFQARAAYRYTYEGREYTSYRITGNRLGGSDNLGDWQKDTAARLEAASAAGTPITVYVNPADPAEAIADRSVRWVLVAMMGMFALMFGGAALLALYLAVGTWRGTWAFGRKGAARSHSMDSGLVLKWAFAIGWNLFCFTMLGIAIVAGAWVGVIVLLVFAAIGVLVLWGCVEETLPRFRMRSTARRNT